MVKSDHTGEQPLQTDPRFGSVDCMFFVIGAQKSGTTWLSRYFRKHPNVSVPNWKEHKYWNEVEGNPQDRSILEGARKRFAAQNAFKKLRLLSKRSKHSKRVRGADLAYQALEHPFAPHKQYADALFEGVGPETLAVGELSPSYAFLKSSTFDEMYHLAENCRFIYILRDPVSRFLSSAAHRIGEPVQGSGLIRDGKPLVLSDLITDPHCPEMMHSRYDLTSQRLEAVIPRDRIKYLFFEHLFEQDCIKDLCGFLGLPFKPAPLDRKRNSAGARGDAVQNADRALIARHLKPVYDFAMERFGNDLPAKWQESLSLLSSRADPLLPSGGDTYPTAVEAN